MTRDPYASLKQGLVGAWIPSISGSGLLLPDLSGRGNHGALTNMDASDWVSASYESALDFDGSNDRVESRAISYQSLPLTIAAWVKPNTVSGVQMLASHYGAEGNRAWYLALINAAPRILVSPDGTLIPYGQGGTVTTDWTHVVGVVGPSAFQIYINGNSVSTALTGSYPTQIFNSTANVVLGDRATTDAPLNGQLDDIRIYNRALTESEIKLLASEPGIGFKPNKKLSRFSTRYAYKPAKPRNYSVIRNRDPNYSTLRQGLVAAYCPSISGQGNVLPDLVGGNHGTLTNMTADDWVSSGDGRALDFDGSDDYIQGNFRYYGTGAISFWVKTSTEIGAAVAFCVNASSTDLMYIGLGQNISGTLTNELITVATIFGSARIEGYTTSDRNELLDNKWHHIAVVQRTANSSYEIYLDGIKKTTTVGDATLTSFGIGVATGDLIQFGSRRFTATQGVYLTGQLDDIRIYSNALSESEIKLLASKRGIGLEPRKPKITFTDLGVQKTYSVVRVKETDYATLRQGLVGAWCPSLANGGSGNTLADVSGYGNHGVLTNMSPDDWVSSQYGRALDIFDDQYIDCRAMNGLSLAYPFSMSCWIQNITSNNIDFSPFGKIRQIGGYQGPMIYFASATNAAVSAYWAGGTRATGATVVTQLSNWTHVGICWTGSQARVYVNGRLDGTGNTTTAPNASTSSVNIGRYDSEGYGQRSMRGRIDDCRIYDRCLTDSEWSLLASKPGIGLQPSPTRFIAREKKTGLRRRILTGQT